jgi:hypothetical protein
MHHLKNEIKTRAFIFQVVYSYAASLSHLFILAYIVIETVVAKRKPTRVINPVSVGFHENCVHMADWLPGYTVELVEMTTLRIQHPSQLYCTLPQTSFGLLSADFRSNFLQSRAGG